MDMRLPPRRKVEPALLLGILLLAVAAPSPAAVGGDNRRQALQHYRAGEAALSSEHYDEAVAEFRQAISLDPLLVMAHYGLGQAHMALKDYPAAVRAYLNCRKAFEDDLASRYQSEMEWGRRLDDQIRALEDQIAILSSGRPSSGSQRPLSSVNVTNLQQQIDTLRARRKVGASAPLKTPPWISVALGSAYFRSNDMAGAEREYKAALDADPKVGEAHSNLAVIQMLTGRLDEAEQELKLAEKAGFNVNPALKKDLKKRKEQPDR
jgi:tetratricopeptide (TPR) repeat protein